MTAVLRGAVGGRTASTWVAAGGLAWLALNAVILATSPLDRAVGLTIAQVIAIGGTLAVVAVARRTEAPETVRVLVVLWGLKMVGTAARYYVLQVTYGGAGDANRYAYIGTLLAEKFKSGDISTYQSHQNLVGTQFVEMVTGGLFAVTGPTLIGASMVFSTLGFVGLYLTFRALRVSYPEADPTRLALLGLGLPSMVFWPSSLGKEALMVFAIGIVVYGAAWTWTGRRGGVLVIAVGLVASALVRPHVTVLLVAGLLGASVLVRAESRPEAVLLKLLRTGLFVGALVGAVAASSAFFGLSQVDSSGVSDVLERTEEQTAQGGSSFAAVNPLLFPVAAVTVLYRPFPFEAGNLQGAIASVEGTLLLYLTWRRRRHLLGMISHARERPMVAFTLVYAAVFVMAFSQFGNFGLLARQRVQLYPLLVGLLAVDAARAPVTRAVRAAGGRARERRTLAGAS
ncbi:MAG TPA: hypothetical protein VF228_00600 [Iamia sp.]